MTREEAVDWWLEWMRLSAAPGDAVALWRMFYDSDVRDVLATIRVPTLVLSRGGEMEPRRRHSRHSSPEHGRRRCQAPRER